MNVSAPFKSGNKENMQCQETTFDFDVLQSDLHALNQQIKQILLQILHNRFTDFKDSLQIHSTQSKQCANNFDRRQTQKKNKLKLFAYGRNSGLLQNNFQ